MEQAFKVAHYPLPVGKYRLIARADAADAVAEGNETNNTTAGKSLTLGADLTVTSLTLNPVAPTSTAPTTITATTRNAGPEGAAGTVTRLYRSASRPAPTTCWPWQTAPAPSPS